MKLTAPTHPIIQPVSRALSACGLLVALVASVALAGCGGGGGDAAAPEPPAPPPAVSTAARAAAASGTAQANPACTAIQPFYWEIGDRSAALASGSSGGSSVQAGTVMQIASASKWLYGAYVVQKRGAALDETDRKYLRFQSGYTSFDFCDRDQTVGECAAAGTNAVYTAANDGLFVYGGGHMQQHALLRGLGGLGNAALAAEVRGQLGDVQLTYSQPQPAGGVVTTAAEYAKVLRRMLTGDLLIGGLLGNGAVCASPSVCPGQARGSPAPRGENWGYTLGHWVEPPELPNDGAFSSAGAFGFYPWIDKSKTWYGIVARSGLPGSGNDSIACGRLIRRAWVTATAQ